MSNDSAILLFCKKYEEYILKCSLLLNINLLDSLKKFSVYFKKKQSLMDETMIVKKNIGATLTVPDCIML